MYMGDLKGVSQLMDVVEYNEFESAFQAWLTACYNLDESLELDEVYGGP